MVHCIPDSVILDRFHHPRGQLLILLKEKAEHIKKGDTLEINEQQVRVKEQTPGARDRTGLVVSGTV